MSVPRFNRGFRLRHDEVRKAWVVLAPERLFMLDDQAAEILGLVDGQRSVDDIAALLGEKYNAPASEIMTDVTVMFDDLVTKGALSL